MSRILRRSTTRKRMRDSLHAELRQMMIEMFGLEPAPIASGHLAEQTRFAPTARVHLLRGDLIDQCEAADFLGIEVVSVCANDQVGRRRRTFAPRQIQHEETQNR